MRILDLFAGAGGAAVGYHRAFPDAEIVGVDIVPQPRYPFTFVQADAMTFPLDGFDFIHASPPCQRYSVTRHTHAKVYPDLVGPVRNRLVANGVPWAMENVVGAPMPAAFVLCGASFGLKAYDELSGKVLWLRRHRLFESSAFVMPPACACRGKDIGGVYSGGPNNRNPNWNRGGYTPPGAVRKVLMDIGWMTGRQLCEAIPPAYTEFIGHQLAAVLAERAA